MTFGHKVAMTLAASAILAGAADAKAVTGPWDQYLAEYTVATSGGGTVDLYPSFTDTSANFSGGGAIAWNMHHSLVTHIDFLGEVGSGTGGSISVTDCLMTTSGGVCDSPGTTSTNTVPILNDLSAPLTEWQSDSGNAKWAYVRIVLVPGSTGNSKSYGLHISGTTT
jgi:hypothetical protein